MKGSWIAFIVVQSTMCFPFSLVISFSSCLISFWISVLSLHMEQGPPFNIVQVTGRSLALTPLQWLHSSGSTIRSLMDCACVEWNLTRWFRWAFTWELVSNWRKKYQIEGNCDTTLGQWLWWGSELSTVASWIIQPSQITGSGCGHTLTPPRWQYIIFTFGLYGQSNLIKCSSTSTLIIFLLTNLHLDPCALQTKYGIFQIYISELGTTVPNGLTRI